MYSMFLITEDLRFPTHSQVFNLAIPPVNKVTVTFETLLNWRIKKAESDEAGLG